MLLSSAYVLLLLKWVASRIRCKSLCRFSFLVWLSYPLVRSFVVALLILDFFLFCWQESQRKRGGGAICFQDELLWRNLVSSVTQVEACDVPQLNKIGFDHRNSVHCKPIKHKRRFRRCRHNKRRGHSFDWPIGRLYHWMNLVTLQHFISSWNILFCEIFSPFTVIVSQSWTWKKTVICIMNNTFLGEIHPSPYRQIKVLIKTCSIDIIFSPLWSFHVQHVTRNSLLLILIMTLICVFRARIKPLKYYETFFMGQKKIYYVN